jgi:hypothetical protein
MEPARAVAARPRTLLRYLAATSVAMILVGVCCFATILTVTLPEHTRVASTLRGRGVRVQATVTRCDQALHDDNGAELPVACWVRFTPVGGHPTEARLAFSTRQRASNDFTLVVYDPRDIGTVALPSDIDYWHSLVRSTLDILLLIVSTAMVVLGLGGIVLRRILSRAMKSAMMRA